MDLYVDDAAAMRKNSSDSMDVDVKTHPADRSLDSLDDAVLQRVIEQTYRPHTVAADASASAASKHGKMEQPGTLKTSKTHHHMRFKKPTMLKVRERSKSVGFDESSPINETGAEFPAHQAASDAVAGHDKLYKMEPAMVHAHHSHRNKTKVSKWTRVKEAFRWEKAHVEPSSAAAATAVVIHHKTISAPVLNKPLPTPPTLPAAGAKSHKSGQRTSTVDSLPDDQTTADSPGIHPFRNVSPVFQLSRSGRMLSRTASTSSSSLSECPLESEILKSFADAQQLPRKLKQLPFNYPIKC